MIDTDIIVSLDYRKTRSVEQLICWAEKAFNLPAEPGESIEVFTDRLYHHIGKGTVAYTVVEHNVGACNSAIKKLLPRRMLAGKLLLFLASPMTTASILRFQKHPKMIANGGARGSA